MNMREVILLDNESAKDLFCNKAFITGVHNAKETVTIQSNDGTLVTKKKATLEGYKFNVWYNKKAITNVLSLANVSKVYGAQVDITTNSPRNHQTGKLSGKRPTQRPSVL